MPEGGWLLGQQRDYSLFVSNWSTAATVESLGMYGTWSG